MLYCIVLYCIVLYCIVLYCIVLYDNIITDSVNLTAMNARPNRRSAYEDTSISNSEVRIRQSTISRRKSFLFTSYC